MSDMLSNSVLQSFVFSPLMGVFFGALFAGLSSKPTESAPRTVVETRVIYIERHTKRRKNQNDGAEIYIFAFLLFCVAWQYLRFAPTVLFYVEMFLVSTMSFGLACFFVSALKAHYVDSGWVLRVIVPTTILAACLLVLAEAKSAITPDLTELANRSNVLEFFLGLTQFGRFFSVFHVAGLSLLILIAVIGTLSLLHYLALMNLRTNSPLTGFWSFLTRFTFRFSGTGMYVIAGVLLFVSAFMVDGTLAQWANEISKPKN